MRTAGSIFLLIILVPTSIVVFFVFSLKTNVLTATYLKQELARLDVYTIVEENVAEQIGKVKLENVPIDGADLQALASRVLPAAWLQQNVEGTLDRLFAWFNGPDGTTLSLPIDVRGPKAELIPGVDALIAAALPRLPECTKLQKEGELCRMPNMTVEQLKDLLRQGGIDLAAITSQLPDSIDLINPVLPKIALGNQAEGQSKNAQEAQEKPAADTIQQVEKPPEENGESLQQKSQEIVEKLTTAKAIYHRGLQYWQYVLIAYAVLLLGFLAINSKGWHRLTRWTGILALSIGVLPLAISVASAWVMEKELLPKIVLNNVPPEVQTAVPTLIRDTQHALFFPVLVLSAIFVILGLAAIIGAHWIPVKEKKA